MTTTPDQQRISELAGIAIDARLALTDAIRDACPKPHAYVQHRDHQPAWCNTCGRGENGVVYGTPPDTEVKRLDDGWAWRCWLCGWHGVGLVSEEGARRELAAHDCKPEPDAADHHARLAAGTED